MENGSVVEKDPVVIQCQIPINVLLKKLTPRELLSVNVECPVDIKHLLEKMSTEELTQISHYIFKTLQQRATDNFNKGKLPQLQAEEKEALLINRNVKLQVIQSYTKRTRTTSCEARIVIDDFLASQAGRTK